MGAEIDRLEIEVEVQASKANKQLDLMIDKLTKLATALTGVNPGKLGGIGSSFNSAATGAASTSSSLKTLSNTMKEFTGTSTKMKNSVKSMAQVWGSFYASMFPVIRGVKALGRSIESSMDYIETYNYYNVTMDKIGQEFAKQYQKYGYDSAERYVASFSGRLNELTQKMSGYKVGSDGVLQLTSGMNLGIDPQKMMNYQASVSAVTNSVGLMGETSINTAKALSMLAADMSSFKNVNLSTVMTNLQSGLIGQSRALYKYGIDITNATLQTYAYKYGVSKAVAEMTQGEKMQLRLLAILEQSKVAWGDQANTINSVANQYRIFKQQIANVARMIGNILMPAVQAVLPFVNGLLIATQRLLGFVGGLLGIDFSKIMDGISSGYSGFDAGDIVDDTGDVADNFGEANSNAKKLQRTILGFDQINKLNDPTSNSSSGGTPNAGGGTIDLSGAIADALADYEAVWNEAFAKSQNKAQEWADKISASFKKIWDTAEPTRKAVVKLWDEGLSKFGYFAFDTLQDFWQNFLKPIGAWTLGNDAGLPRFFNITNALLNEIDWGRLQKSLLDFYGALQKPAKVVWTGLMDFYEYFLKPVAVWTMGVGIPQLVDALTGFVEKIQWDSIISSLRNFWDALVPFAKSVGQGLIDFFKGLLDVGADFINKIVPGGLDAIAKAIRGIDPETAERIGKALGSIALGILALKGAAGIIGGVAAFGGKIAGVKEGLGALFGGSGVFAKIGGVLGKAKSIVTGFFGKIAEVFILTSGGAGTLTEAFSTVFGVSLPVVTGIAAVVAGIIDLWRTSETFRNNVKNMLNIIGQAFLYAKQRIWDEGLKPLWDSIKELFDSLYEIYESSGLKQIFEGIVTAIGYVVSIALGGLIIAISEFAKFLANIVKAVVDVLNIALNFVKDFFAKHQDTIDGLKQMWHGLTEFLAGIFSGNWERAWNGVKEIFSGVWNAFVSIVKTPINKILGFVNSLISKLAQGFNWITSKLNNFKIDIPDNPITGEISLGFNIAKWNPPQIPLLAGGGLVNQGQLFLAREKGPELVGMHGNKAAVMNNEQLLDSVADGLKGAITEAMIAVNMESNQQPSNVIVTLQGEAGKIFKVVQVEAKKYERNYMRPAFE